MDLLTWQGLQAWCDGQVKCRLARATAAPVPVGGSLFASRGWREPWRSQWLKTLTQPIVLVTAYHDRPILEKHVASMFAGPHVRHWFGTQCGVTHPQLTAMPIGMHPRSVPYLDAAERRETRDILCYMNFQMGNRWPHCTAEREAVWRTFRSRPWVMAEQRVVPATYAARLGRSQFVISPRGNGWDCYRTYEAIAMGAIPIVRRVRPLSDVCESLPVLIVDDWHEVTPERLATAWAELRGKATAAMSLRYWQQRIGDEQKEIRQKARVLTA